MTIPIIILNYNSHVDCAKCISFLLRQKGVDLEIIVVDNNSHIDDLTALRAICSENRCTLLETHENRGYNAGNNIGLRYVADKGYAYALIANPDMEFPQADYVATLVRVMQREPNTVIVASDIVTPEGIHQNPLKRDGNWRTSWQWLPDLVRPKPTDTYTFIDNYAHSHPCAKVSGCCLLLCMAFVQQIGFFDEGVFLYCEEPILARQVERAGKCIYYTTEAQAVHRHVKSEKGDPLGRLRHWKRSRHYYIDHYSGDHCLGRLVAKSSVSTYVGLLGWYKRMRS